MALPDSYLVTTKNIQSIFNSIINAQAPAKFTNKFLEALGFTSSNDRLYIGIFRSLGLIDSNGIPQERYFRFLDQTESKQVLAEAIEYAYSDLFAVNKKAHEMTANEIKNKMKTLFQGSKTDTVLSLMANTFKALCDYADFSNNRAGMIIKNNPPIVSEVDVQVEKNTDHSLQEIVNKRITTEMHYNIQIHLPETRDIAVYDAIFKSLKEHLL